MSKLKMLVCVACAVLGVSFASATGDQWVVLWNPYSEGFSVILR